MNKVKKFERITKINEYICNKYYIVEYEHNYTTSTIKGYLLNYYGGNIDLLSKEGIYHLQCSDIIFMKPISLSCINEDLKKVCEDSQAPTDCNHQFEPANEGGSYTSLEGSCKTYTVYKCKYCGETKKVY